MSYIVEYKSFRCQAFILLRVPLSQDWIIPRNYIHESLLESLDLTYLLYMQP